MRYQSNILFLLLTACLFSCSSNKSVDPYRDMSAYDIYSQGMAQVEKERFDKAIKDFEALESRYPYGEYTQKGQLALINAYVEQGEYSSAIAGSDRFIRSNPRHQEAAYAYYMKGVASFKENLSTVYKIFPLDRSARSTSLAKKSFEDFKTLLEVFPKSKYAADARLRMIFLRNQLAKHELNIANYYLKKKSYIAAANRCAYIVSQYDGSEFVPAALMIMTKSYSALGLKDLAKDSAVTLKHNFPNSKEAKELTS